jgi:hypothetical protein
VENIRAAFNWRWAVLSVELVVAAACFIAGWRLIGEHRPAPVQLHRGTPAVVTGTDGPLPVPAASPSDGAKAGPRAGQLGLSPGTDLLNRLSRDDFSLYRAQWQVIQVLVDGTRRYVEQRVLPTLMAAG